MHMKKTVAIISIESNGSGEALRHTLESFGYLVVIYRIGRPKHFIDILAGRMISKFDFIIIECHGDNGDIIMTKLSEHIYFPDEPRGNFGFNEINKYLDLKETCIINTGCSTGVENLAKAFIKNNNIYIAPIDYIKGDSGLVFVVLFFYYLSCGLDTETAHKKASLLDAQTNLYVLRK